MKLYHGSKKIVSMPSCDQNNEHSDFGRGFYAAESEELAREWAAADEKGGFVNSVLEFLRFGLVVKISR